MVTTRVNELALRDGDFVSGVAGVGSFDFSTLDRVRWGVWLGRHIC